MSFMTLPPEINSLRMYSGAGSGPMLQAAQAWEGLSAELASAAQSFSSVISSVSGQAWQGAASRAMTQAAAPYVGWLSAAASRASGAATQAQAVVGEFEAALSATVHPLAVQANRNGLVQLVMSNLFGQNWPAIAETDFNYAEMWAQDVAAMVGYHGGASAAASQLLSGAANLPSIPSLPGVPASGVGGTGSVGGGSVGGVSAGGSTQGDGYMGGDATGGYGGGPVSSGTAAVAASTGVGGGNLDNVYAGGANVVDSQAGFAATGTG